MPVTEGRSRWRALGRAALGIGLAAWVLSRLSISWTTLSRAWLPLLVFAALGPLGVAVEAMRLRLVVRVEGIELALPLAIRVVLASAFFAVAVPGGTGGDVVKLYYLSREHRKRVVELGTLVLLDRAVAMAALFFLLLLLAILIPHGALSGEAAELVSIGSAFGVLLVLGGIAVVLAAERLAALLQARRAAIPRVGWIVRILTAVAQFRSRRRLLLGMFAVAVIGHSSMLSAFAFAAHRLLGGPQPILAAALAALGFVANALPITPAGVGVGEAAFEHLFRLVGLPGAALLLLSWRLGCLPIWGAGFLVYLGGVSKPGREDPEVAHP